MFGQWIVLSTKSMVYELSVYQLSIYEMSQCRRMCFCSHIAFFAFYVKIGQNETKKISSSSIQNSWYLLHIHSLFSQGQFCYCGKCYSILVTNTQIFLSNPKVNILNVLCHSFRINSYNYVYTQTNTARLRLKYSLARSNE